MKVLRSTLIATAVVLGAGAANAATLGTVEYQVFAHSSTLFKADLGGTSPTIPDATVIWNDYNGAATLPGGLPAGYDIHIPATFVGDNNTATADAFDDRYLFKLDPATMGGQMQANGDATLNINIGVNTGFQASEFSFYKSNSNGDVGTTIAAQSGAGRLLVSGLEVGETYVMRVTGNLRADNPNTARDESTNVGQYKIVVGLNPIPVPPALMLLLTAVGALFGFGRMRKAAPQAA